MARSALDLEPVWPSIHIFLRWLDRQGCASHDPYDVWGTRYGLFARRLYYRKSWLGLPLIAPVLALEIVCPGARSWLARKERFATADAQLLLAFLNLHHLAGDNAYLDKALDLGKDLLSYSIPGYHGHCWGYPFDWQHGRGMWKENTPFITATPYCFEAFLGLFDATGDPVFRDIPASIARFVHQDLRDTPTSPDAAAGSYSPTDNSRVVNASAYRAMVLFEAAARFANDDYRRAAQKNLNFILQSQRADGAWLYTMDEDSKPFVDHFHTCFVLKNLFKLNRRLQSAAVAASIARGFRYYRENLFRPNGLPKQFAIQPRAQIVRLEMYDFAEAITLGALLRDAIPEAFAMAQRLASVLCRQYQLPDGHFVTRVYRGGWKHTLPFLRWPQAQIFYALTNLLAASGAAVPSLTASSASPNNQNQ
ncbi:MAG: hypothetical protein ABSA47_00700 [Verrucomicrobiota bacterium]